MPGLIHRRGKARWRARVMVNGEIRTKWFPDASKSSERAAAAWEAEEKERFETEITSQTAMVCGLAEWADAYLDHAMSRLSKATYHEKRHTFGFMARQYSPETGLDVIAAEAEAYLEHQAKVRSGNAANKDRKNLAAAWDFGARRLAGFPQVPNPFRAVERFGENRQPRYVPPEEHFWKVYDVAPDQQDRLLLKTALHTAARKGELFRLTWADVDFVGESLRLGTRKRKGGGLEYDSLPLTGELRTELLDWCEARPVKGTPYVFVCLERTPICEEHYGQPFTARNSWMRRLCHRAGVKRFGMHAIRHLTAVSLYRSGYSLATIQGILRHQRAGTTEVYLRSLGLDLSGAREALESVTRQKPGKLLPLHAVAH